MDREKWEDKEGGNVNKQERSTKVDEEKKKKEVEK